MKPQDNTGVISGTSKDKGLVWSSSNPGNVHPWP
jgi:hypothetical protein